MAKILEASCDASGTVTAMGFVVDGAIVLSEGKAASQGVLFIEGSTALYLPSSALDLKTSIEKTIDVITAAVNAFTKAAASITAIAAVPVGPWPTVPTLSADAAAITAAIVQLNATKAQLTTLKGGLI